MLQRKLKKNKTMPVLQFGDFQFDIALSRLTHAHAQVSLDPRQIALLTYFLQNPQRIINRDELQTHIWQGVIVTDNAINKLIANLRKALRDDAKEPKYVQTVPKLGYRFVCDVTPIEVERAKPNNQSQQTVNSPQFSNIWVVGTTVFIICTFIFWLIQSSSSDPSFGDTNTLTRFHGLKHTPVFIENENNFLFINDTHRNKTVWLSDSNTALPQQINQSGRFIDDLISHYNGKLLYKGYEQECGWFITNFNIKSSQIGKHVEQFTLCGNLTVHSSKFNERNETLYVLAHPKKQEHLNQLYHAQLGQPLALLSVDLGENWRIVAMDLSQLDNRVLFTAHSLDGKSGAFSYDPTLNEVKKLTEFETLVEHIVWDHNAQGVVFITQAPNSRLMHLDLQSNNTQLLANVNERLCCNIVRHPNLIDYVFTSSDINTDIKWLSANYSLDNSSVIDREPVFANTKEGHYFLSNRSGSSQIYYQAPNKHARLVTELAKNVRVDSMALSNDDTFLLLRDKHRLWLVSTKDEVSINNTFIDGYAYAEHWLSNTLFSVTVKQHKVKHVFIFNTQMQKIAQLQDDFTQILTDPLDPATYYFVGSEGKLYRASPEQIFSPTTAQQLSAIGDLPEFSRLLIEDRILYVVSRYGDTLSTYKIGDTLQFLSKQPINVYLGFDVKNGQVIYSGKTHYRSEVYRTVAY
ncbi:hypothetical protein PSECIP111951_02640 [Pseudoalteromonas holothuriae]|uniref:OmpR/PhoB-type domain-containing protein n=1 Tax=Pseudoalteromonas holothuriae TaxID=2963714 RepID=A0ABN8UMW5_9GAMM|nr:transcriptional regulator [Pseudoalteromonas sp. CIP111951]CAH9062180.1 hypothetical protein PSECIP111951_02640 [Pseudoalteromonas sp. CIP111951]